MLLTNIIKKGELLDCYGELLTKRQRDCLDLYYNENLTLAEIAEHFRISRQAVHDAMRHGEEQLAYYEKTLCLLYKKKEKQKAIDTLMDFQKLGIKNQTISDLLFELTKNDR